PPTPQAGRATATIRTPSARRRELNGPRSAGIVQSLPFAERIAGSFCEDACLKRLSEQVGLERIHLKETPSQKGNRRSGPVEQRRIDEGEVLFERRRDHGRRHA